MPTEYRFSGPEILRDNRPVQPKAAVHICEGCGYENAAFGETRGGELLSYCGWQYGGPACVGKGRQSAR